MQQKVCFQRIAQLYGACEWRCTSWNGSVLKAKGNRMKTNSVFTDAVAVWHMADKSGLTVHGAVELGVPLEGAEREASLARGGDGCVASFSDGWLSVGGDALKIGGSGMTLCLRLNDRSKAWSAPLFTKDDQKDAYGAIMSADAGQLRYIWRTTPAIERTTTPQTDSPDYLKEDYLNGVMRLNVPVAMIGADGWHDIVMRFCSPSVELFVDGVLVDENWPHGELHGFFGPFLIGAGWRDGQKVSGFNGLIDHVALWNRALTDDEVAGLSGGAKEIARRDLEILGPHRPVPQYWRPRGHNCDAGDCMLFVNRGRLHLFYLFDRRHHGSKWGRGAQEWAHLSTADLASWVEHPMALTNSYGWECPHGTGSLIEYEGKIYAYYAEFSAWGNFKDSPYKELSICMAESDDGIRFVKRGKISPRGFDSHTMQDPTTGLFHLLTPGSGQQWPHNWPDGKNGLLDYTTTDPARGPWTLQTKHFHEAFGCCPHVFEWNGWHYLWMENRFWISRNLMGPWKEHSPARLISMQVPKSAVFGSRAFAAGWLGEDGWGGEIVFHELVQNADGSLGDRFVPEMMPPCGAPVILRPVGTTLAGLPRNSCVKMELQPLENATFFSLRLCSTEIAGSGLGLRFDPIRRTAAFLFPEGVRTDAAPFTEIDVVDGLDRIVKLEVVIAGDIVDVCINDCRTIATRCKGLTGDRIAFDGCVAANIEVRPLK